MTAIEVPETDARRRYKCGLHIDSDWLLSVQWNNS